MDIWFVDYLAPDISICIFLWWFEFCPCLFHFLNAFRLFLCLRWCLSYFSTLNHLWISFSSSFSLPKVVNKDRSERQGKGQLLHSPWRPPSQPAQHPEGCLLPPSTFFHPHDRMDSQDDLPSLMPRLRTLNQLPSSRIHEWNICSCQSLCWGYTQRKRGCLRLKGHMGKCC